MPHYVASTIGYGIVGVLAIIAAIYFALQHNWFLVIIAVTAAYVSYDNFFCGTRARACGYHAPGHYVIPPFLK